MTNSVIGALRVVMGMDTAAFSKGLTDVQREMNRAARAMDRMGTQFSRIGTAWAVGLSAPLAAAGLGAISAAKDFETALIDVRIATKATTGEMAAMEEQARAIGASTIFSAGQAAGAMEMLAKTGVSVKDIMGGAAKATVDLASATGAELEPAAAAVADSMAQFGLAASQLPWAVNQITGAVNESKLSFDDFQMAMGQSGGVAANLGVSFADFNAVLAATSPLFQSGSDAGTSFKTFLTTMIPKTDAAAGKMKDLGISFFEADGSMKSMSDVAEMLKTALAGLSEEARNDALTKMFGADAMRTAIGLMDAGAAGLDKVKVKIAETDAAAQAAERMGGLAGQLEQLKGAFEELGIAIGKSGLLKAVTEFVSGLGDLLDWAAKLPAPILAIGTAMAAVAVVGGPVVLLAGQMMVAWGSVLTLGGALTPVWLAFGGALLQVSASATIAGAAARGLGLAMSFIMGPWGLVITGVAVALAVLANNMMGAATASKEMRKTTDALQTALDEYQTAALNAATATGKEKDAALEAVKAKRLLAQEAIRAARAQLIQAEATLALSRAETRRKIDADRFNFRGDAAGSIAGANPFVIARERQAAADAATAEKALAGSKATLDRIEASLKAPINFGGGNGNGVDGLSRSVKTTNEVAKEAASAVREFADELKSLMDSLMTPEERAAKQRLAEAETLQKAYDAGLITTSELLDLRDKQRARDFREAFPGTVKPAPDQSPDLQKSNLPTATFGGVVMSPDAAEALRTQMAGTFRGALDSLRNGGTKGLFQWMADQLSDRLMDSLADILTNFADQLMKSMSSSGGGSFANIGSALASMFGGSGGAAPAPLPGFATGGSFTVGGSGGIDSQLMQFRATPGEMVNIRHGNDNGGSGPVVFDLRGAVMTADLLEQMNTISIRTGGQVYGRIKGEQAQAMKAQKYRVAR